MNGDRPPLGSNHYDYSQQNSVADALLLEQMRRQQQLQRQDDEWRGRLFGISAGAQQHPRLLQRPSGVAWNLPPLPQSEAALTSATLQRMNLREDSSVMVAQMLHNQRLAASLRDSEKAMLLSKLGNRGFNQEVLLGRSSMPSSLSLAAAMQSERLVHDPEKSPQKRPHSAEGPDDGSSSRTSASNGTSGSFPGPPKKKRMSLDEAANTFKNGTTTTSSPAFFPLPNKDQEPKQETPNLISFQRTWGKLEKCKMRTELFRRRLERGDVQLTGVTRSILLQIKQQRQHPPPPQQEEAPKKKKKQEAKEGKKKQTDAGKSKKKDKEVP